MMTEQFRAYILKRLDAGDAKLNSAWKAGRKRTRVKLRMYSQVMDLLKSAWDGADVYTLEKIVKRCPLITEGRVKSEKNPDKFKRIARMAIEALRKEFGYPVLSRPNYRSADYDVPVQADNPKRDTSNVGFWFPRSQRDIDEYFERTEKEIIEFMQSRIETNTAERRILDKDGSVFDLEVEALKKHSEKFSAARVVNGE